MSRQRLQHTLRGEQILKTIVRANSTAPAIPGNAVTLPDSCSVGDWVVISHPCSLLIQINLSNNDNKPAPINWEWMRLFHRKSWIFCSHRLGCRMPHGGATKTAERALLPDQTFVGRPCPFHLHMLAFLPLTGCMFLRLELQRTDFKTLHEILNSLCTLRTFHVN